LTFLSKRGIVTSTRNFFPSIWIYSIYLYYGSKNSYNYSSFDVSNVLSSSRYIFLQENKESLDNEDAYSCPNQYYFGTELLVSPFVFPANSKTRLSRQIVWLPKGKWFHFFSGYSYDGDSWVAYYGQLHEIPVFAKAGAIVPLSLNTKSHDLPTEVFICIHYFH
jgi:alpha-glucosidase (family GH31 glycosyl hydrolase)